MVSWIRARLTFANVAMTFAIIFAMSGGAYAAKGVFRITSIKQIKPSVVKQLTGKTGARGANGQTGPAGPTGEKGAAGVEGKEGKPGTEGQPGKDGESVSATSIAKGNANCKEGGSEFSVGGKHIFACNGAEGKEGSPWTAGGVLPSGKTETGTWSFTTSGNGLIVTSISFPIPLAKSLESTEVHYVGPSDNISACPGTANEPKAEAGALCVYQGSILNVIEEGGKAEALIFRPGASITQLILTTEERGASVNGANLLFKAGEEPPSIAWGSWAVTAS